MPETVKEGRGAVKVKHCCREITGVSKGGIRGKDFYKLEANFWLVCVSFNISFSDLHCIL